MGLCISNSKCFKDNKVVSHKEEEVDSDSSDDDYVERITHITADIHERIRKKVINDVMIQ